LLIFSILTNNYSICGFACKDSFFLWFKKQKVSYFINKKRFCLFLTKSHYFYSQNPILAEACFHGGYIDSWGSGIMKIVDSCKAAGLPSPIMEEDGGGFIVRLFKDNLTEDQLSKRGLNERQIKAVLYIKENGSITNREYQEINQISNRTATYDLKDLVENFSLLKMSGAGVGTFYELM
jgi:ATP-dependent DNA helicase RecG